MIKNRIESMFIFTNPRTIAQTTFFFVNIEREGNVY